MISLAIKNKSVIEGKRVTKDNVIVIALSDFMVKQGKVMNKYCANMCK